MAAKESDSVRLMEQFHAYLEKNYVGGSERFFSPTGFLEEFQKTVELEVASARNHVTVGSVDKAAALLEPLVAGSEGVYDLCAEPGSGKTSVLPFRFPSKKVVVALPTPFDAWTAFNMATSDARLYLKGLKLGPQGANVVYTDSYMAAKAMLGNYMDYDVMIVDECDSPRGVTRFLAEVRTKGKFVLRMSASHGRSNSGPSRSFRVTESTDMPDVTKDPNALAEYVKKHKTARSLMLLPDADTAQQMGQLLEGSRVLCTRSHLGDIARAIVNQDGSALFVADDTCARGLNLNVTTLFDSQLVAEYGSIRPISDVELLQRKGRVGRLCNGSYRSPGLECLARTDNQIDVVRHNVVRSLADIRQLGASDLHVKPKEAAKLMCSDVEPYEGMVAMRASGGSIVKSSALGDRHETAVTSGSSSTSEGSVRVKAPKWLTFYQGKEFNSKSTVDQIWSTKNKSGDHVHKFVRRRSGLSTTHRSSSASGGDDTALTEVRDLGKLSLKTSAQRRKELPTAELAPYAIESSSNTIKVQGIALPMAPPIMDLTQLTYNMDWPSLIRDRLVAGGDLPTLVPAGSWRHTSVGGLGNNWLARLESLAVSDVNFSDSEFEVVCRAWNLLVGQAWIRKTPGLSSYANADKLEFCARYFQSYFLQQETE